MISRYLACLRPSGPDRRGVPRQPPGRPARRHRARRVLRADGAPIDVGRATGREVVKAIFALTGILYVISALWAVWHPGNKALHDLIAGTRVVMADSSPAA